MKLHQGPRLQKLPTGQHVLLNELWKKFGGMRPASKRIGVPEYLLNMWRKRGAVPLTKCRVVSEALDVPLYALNFRDMTDLTGDYPGGWAYAVESCGFSKEIVTKILKAKEPK
jgi:hypothetical protein